MNAGVTLNLNPIRRALRPLGLAMSRSTVTQGSLWSRMASMSRLKLLRSRSPGLLYGWEDTEQMLWKENNIG